MVSSYRALVATLRSWYHRLFGVAPLPTTVDAIAQDIVGRMTAGDRKTLEVLPRHHMIKFHGTVGMYVRNLYGLWDEDHPLRADGEHPDDISMEILYKVWDDINGATPGT